MLIQKSNANLRGSSTSLAPPSVDGGMHVPIRGSEMLEIERDGGAKLRTFKIYTAKELRHELCVHFASMHSLQIDGSSHDEYVACWEPGQAKRVLAISWIEHVAILDERACQFIIRAAGRELIIAAPDAATLHAWTAKLQTLVEAERAKRQQPQQQQKGFIQQRLPSGHGTMVTPMHAPPHLRGNTGRRPAAADVVASMQSTMALAPAPPPMAMQAVPSTIAATPIAERARSYAPLPASAAPNRTAPVDDDADADPAPPVSPPRPQLQQAQQASSAVPPQTVVLTQRKEGRIKSVREMHRDRLPSTIDVTAFPSARVPAELAHVPPATPAAGMPAIPRSARSRTTAVAAAAGGTPLASAIKRHDVAQQQVQPPSPSTIEELTYSREGPGASTTAEPRTESKRVRWGANQERAHISEAQAASAHDDSVAGGDDKEEEQCYWGGAGGDATMNDRQVAKEGMEEQVDAQAAEEDRELVGMISSHVEEDGEVCCDSPQCADDGRRRSGSVSREDSEDEEAGGTSAETQESVLTRTQSMMISAIDEVEAVVASGGTWTAEHSARYYAKSMRPIVENDCVPEFIQALDCGECDELVSAINVHRR